MTAKPRLLFVSPRFLLPADSGGRIRTTEVLRNLKGGAFHVTLLGPATAHERERFAHELDALCDVLVHWEPEARGPGAAVTRLRHVVSELPIPVATDRSAAGCRAVARELARRPDVVVFDFPHAAVLAPSRLDDVASVLFTHNVEAEIFARHARVATDPLRRWLWRNQHRKMHRFERRVLGQFERVVAVSARDRDAFARDYGIEHVSVIPTGVNLDHFRFREPGEGHGIVFTGSMDWLANVDGIEWLMNEVWPAVAAAVPTATMTVVGRDPPARLVGAARDRGLAWTFTGRVDDIRPHTHRAAAYVIPLRVGGGTRIKAYEAMAMGVPVVSTSVGVEGLDVEPGRHYLRADEAAGLAQGLVRLLSSRGEAIDLARRARAHVEARYSNAAVGRCFEAICLQTLQGRRERSSPLRRSA